MDQKQLRELENRCIQEHAPTCTAACPIHVDVRGIMAAVQKGDFALGLKTLRKTMPFPGIISHICDQPCMPVCKRGEVGAALEIAAIEKACVLYGGDGETITALPAKPKSVAIVGGGLSGMTVAYDLRRKGYRVVIYEAGSQLGGSLWEIPQERLPWQVISHDIAVLDQLGVIVHTSTSASKVASNGRRPPLALLREQYDAIYLGMGIDFSEISDLVLDTSGHLLIDPLTYATSQEGVFAGGNLLLTTVSPKTPSSTKTDATSTPKIAAAPAPTYRPAILSVMDGRRAATSIDRYLQKVSLTAARVNEGPYTTRLFTNTKGIPVAKTTPLTDPAQGYSKAEAIQEAERCILCECMECVKACEYLKHYGGYPKKYVREIYNNLSIVMGERYSNKLINSCSLCGQCGELCPEDLDMGAVCREARQIMVAQKRMPPSAHDFALRDMAFSNSEKFAMAHNQPGAQTSGYAFFPGCQLSASSPAYVEQIYGYLQEKLPMVDGKGVGLLLGCCAAPADWAGQKELFQQEQGMLRAEIEKLGNPKLVLACSSCYQVFKSHLPEVEIVSLWDLMDTHGLPANGNAIRRKSSAPLAVHDPCSTRYESHIHDSARNLIHKLGYEIEELEFSREKTECCSYGGQMWLANPEVAQKVVKRRVAESPQDYITYCAMCRDFYARQGKPTLHLLDLIYGADPDMQMHKRGPGYSQRHENRYHLKRKMLKEIWGEDMEEGKPYENIQLFVTAEAQTLLDDRLILVEDIQQVIDYAERSGKKLLNKKSGRFLASFKPAAVTYWVEYTPQEEGYTVYKAYSHRMEVSGEAQK